MWVCLCAQVTDTAWREALNEHGTPQQASMATGAGQGCGGCRDHLVPDRLRVIAEPGPCPPLLGLRPAHV